MRPQGLPQDCPGFVLHLTLVLPFPVIPRAQSWEADEYRMPAGCLLTPRSLKTAPSPSC